MPSKDLNDKAKQNTAEKKPAAADKLYFKVSDKTAKKLG